MQSFLVVFLVKLYPVKRNKISKIKKQYDFIHQTTNDKKNYKLFNNRSL
ncbi:hypothetical protein VCRA2119O147_350026 [Vibrio crassostreae]|nr:hypothetical protein VCRA2119O147_350026 [Vibrio crassostreae]CAK2818101.1 hypothetical protein VCRA2110O183_320025 [Vibrio crassostreae]CAK2902522.1 hypothetical protein VCRA2121O264_320027 [Vibrio crassostreae]CAK3570698.1 hypothetical protein VCRA2121O262_330020 [Vibrio crassostreae]